MSIVLKTVPHHKTVQQGQGREQQKDDAPPSFYFRPVPMHVLKRRFPHQKPYQHKHHTQHQRHEAAGFGFGQRYVVERRVGLIDVVEHDLGELQQETEEHQHKRHHQPRAVLEQRGVNAGRGARGHVQHPAPDPRAKVVVHDKSAGDCLPHVDAVVDDQRAGRSTQFIGGVRVLPPGVGRAFFEETPTRVRAQGTRVDMNATVNALSGEVFRAGTGRVC